MKIDDANLDAFTEAFEAAMKPLEEKFDITIEKGAITYYSHYFTFKVNVNDSQDPETVAEENFDAEVWRYEEYGLRPGMYRRMFIGRDGRHYALMGLRRNAKKNPLQILSLQDDKTYRAGIGFIKEILNGKYIGGESKVIQEGRMY